MSVNLDITAIETDRALADILSNFSPEYIQDLLTQAFMWKFRPFENRMPNYAYIFEQQYKGIKDNYVGPTPELIDQDRDNTYEMMINIICNNYNLIPDMDNITTENIYSICYILYQLLLSEFTERLIGFYSNYIVTHQAELIAALPEEKRNIKSSYSKKMYADPAQICIYENMVDILDMVASLDIPFYNLLIAISDENTANFITTYISDAGDIYKNYFASYVYDPATRAQMITKVKLAFVQITSDKMNIINGVENQ